MNRRVWQKRAVCVALVVFLLLIFCAVWHSCDHSHCPVCMLTAAFRMGLGLAALALGLRFLPRFSRCLRDVDPRMEGREGTLVTLKVKLSD